MSEFWMGPEGHPGVAEEGLQDDFAVSPGRDSVVDQQGGDNARSSGVPVLDVFADLPSPLPVTIRPFRNITAVSSRVAGLAGLSLVQNMVSRRPGQTFFGGQKTR